MYQQYDELKIEKIVMMKELESYLHVFYFLFLLLFVFRKDKELLEKQIKEMNTEKNKYKVSINPIYIKT